MPRKASSSASATREPGATIVLTARSLGWCVNGPLLSSPDRAPDRDPPARRTQPVPARAGNEARGRDRPAAYLVRQARARGTRAGAPRRARAPLGPTASNRGARGLDPAPATRGAGWFAGPGHRPPLLGPG